MVPVLPVLGWLLLSILSSPPVQAAGLSKIGEKVTYPYPLDPTKITDKLYGGSKFIRSVSVLEQQV